MIQIGDVHRSGNSAAVAVSTAEELSHHPARVRALSETVTVPAMVGDDCVIVSESRAGPCGDRLLADREVDEAG
jgi:hypothetical protein